MDKVSAPLRREIVPRVLGVWLLTLVIVAPSLSPGATRALQLGAGAFAGTVASAWVIAVARSRRVRLKAISEQARSLAAPPSEPRGGAPVLGPVAPGNDEFAPLRVALAALDRWIEAQLREVAKKSRNLEALIDAIDEPVLATDNSDAVLLCNRSADALFAASPGVGSIVGRPIREVLTQASVLELISAAKMGHVKRGKMRITTPTGVRAFQISASPVPAAWGQGVFGAVLVMRDVTELDHAAQVKTDFVANASHELRTPVAAIRGAAETLHDAVKDDPEMAGRLADMIVAHASRLEDMIRDLLDLSRVETPDAPVKIEAINPADLAAVLGLLFQDLCRDKGVSIVCEFDPALVGMRSDRNVLMLILRNLVENAVKFAYNGTVVRVVGRLAPGQPGMARFEVIDKGIGIPLNQQERVFERYYQVDAARQGMTGSRGTGLGLSIVKHAAKALGGRCGLVSVWRDGTTAWVEVPVA